MIGLRHYIRMTLLASCCIALAQAASAAGPTAAAPAVNCSGMEDVDQFGQMKLDEAKIIECINKGYDPPISWRPPPGKVVTSGGAGSVLTHAQNAPDKPPRVAGAAPSMSNARWGFSLQLPPWQGFPFSTPGGGSSSGGGSSGGGGGVGGAGSCPMETDPAFGEKAPLGVTKSLTCGGAAGINTGQYSYMPNPNKIAFINGFTMNIYGRSGGGYQLVETVNLPTFLCKLSSTGGDGGTTQWERWFDLRDPVPQIIAYNDSLQNFVIRLQQPDPSRQPPPNKPQFPKGDPENPASSQYVDYDMPWFNTLDPDPDAPKERFLVLPAVNGAPDMPKDENGNPIPNPCLDVETHYVNEPANINWTEFQFRHDAICDASTLYPNSANCPKMLLTALMDTPQLIFEPATTAEFLPITGLSQFMIKAPAQGVLMMQHESVMRLAAGGFAFTLPEGGTIALGNGSFLRMHGPATTMNGGKSWRLDGGGQVETRDGTVVGSPYAAGATVAAPAFPYALRPNKAVNLPAGVLLPTKPNGYIRLPITQP